MHHSGSIGGVSRSALGALGVPMDLAATPASPPPAWQAAWSVAEYFPEVTLTRHADGAVAALDKTPAEIFDLFSTARSAPANTYYVSPNGVDSTATGTEASPYRSIWKAVAAANASGQPSKVVVKAGEYGKPYNPSQFLALRPSVDIAFVAQGGRVTVGTWDDFSAPSLDPVQTNCYSYSLSNVDRVIDRTRIDADGFLVDLRSVASAAICNRTPGSWALEGGKIYINRADGKAVTNANTRVLRSTGGTWRFDVPVSVYVGADDSISGFDTQGGSLAAGFHYQPATKPAQMKAVVVERCTFRYCGGAVYSGNGTTISDLHGIALFADCDASNNTKDGFSAGNSAGLNSEGHLLTLNCRSIVCGGGLAQSCNGFTLHEDVVGADFAGQFARSSGGAVRCVADSLTWLVGSDIRNDRGDIVLGGTTPPGGVMANGNAQIWADRAHIAMPPAMAPVLADVGAAVRLRAMAPLRSAAQGTGTIEAW